MLVYNARLTRLHLVHTIVCSRNFRLGWYVVVVRKQVHTTKDAEMVFISI